MSKIASYLNEHVLGEVTAAKTIRKKYSVDGSILTVTPEVVAFPRVTNDIRKIARFTWQLAEKGHVIGVTIRGLGANNTGAALGKGIVVDTSKHLSGILQILPKDRLIHVQPGIALATLQETLKWSGLSLATGAVHGSIGGLIANGAASSGLALEDRVEKLEIILANGDIIETGRITRKEISKKLGLQTFEGEIYRKLEGLIEDNHDLVAKLARDDSVENTGYARLSKVRGKDGSFDLTPLFFGSQGTLGVISEAVLRADFYVEDAATAVITTESLEKARDIADSLIKLRPESLRIFDGELYRRAVAQGARYASLGDVSQLGAVIYISFRSDKQRALEHSIKKLRKILRDAPVGIIDSNEHDETELAVIASVATHVPLTDKEADALPIINGAFVPSERREEFELALLELAHTHHIELPIDLDVLSGTYNVHPLLKLSVVSDKQKLFRLMTDYAALVHEFGGVFNASGAEGRLKVNAAWSVLDADEIELFEQLRGIFDPLGTLNPDVKQKHDLRVDVAALRSSFDALDLS